MEANVNYCSWRCGNSLAGFLQSLAKDAHQRKAGFGSFAQNPLELFLVDAQRPHRSISNQGCTSRFMAKDRHLTHIVSGMAACYLPLFLATVRCDQYTHLA